MTTGFARALLQGDRLTPLGIAGLLLGLLGVVVLARPDPSNLLDAGGVGVVLVFAAVASFALGSVLTRRSSATPGIELQTAWSMLLGALVMHGISVGLGERVGAIEWTPEGLAALGFLSLVASALGFLVYFDLLDRLGPVEINLVSYVAPLFAALAGFVLLDEPITAPTVAGFLLIVAGFALVKRGAIAGEVRRLRDQPSGD